MKTQNPDSSHRPGSLTGAVVNAADVAGSPSHTPGPWPAWPEAMQRGGPVRAFDRLPNGRLRVTLFADDYERARQCVNACEGMDNPARAIGILRDLNQTYRAQRDELAAALREAEPYVDQRAAMTDDPKPREVWNRIIKALKAVTP